MWLIDSVRDAIVGGVQRAFILGGTAGDGAGRCLYIDDTAAAGDGGADGCIVAGTAAAPGGIGTFTPTSDLPARPAAGGGTVRVVVISDTHERHGVLAPLPVGDLLLHCGDVCMASRLKSRAAAEATLRSLDAFIAEWLARAPRGAQCVVVGGNHDRWMERLPAADVAALLPHATVLRDAGCLACGGRVAVFGSPASRGGSMNNAFQLPAAPTVGKHAGRRATVAERARQRRMTAVGAAAGWTPQDAAAGHSRGAGGTPLVPRVQRGCDILITHGPARDFPLLKARQRWKGVDVSGDGLPRARVLHCFGHIHMAYGAARAATGELQLCASTMAKGYRPTHPPCVVDLAIGEGSGDDGGGGGGGGGGEGGHTIEARHHRESKSGLVDVSDVHFESPEMRPATATGECSPRTLAAAQQQQGAVSDRIAGDGGRKTPSAFTRLDERRSDGGGGDLTRV